MHWTNKIFHSSNQFLDCKYKTNLIKFIAFHFNFFPHINVKWEGNKMKIIMSKNGRKNSFFGVKKIIWSIQYYIQVLHKIIYLLILHKAYPTKPFYWLWCHLTKMLPNTVLNCGRYCHNAIKLQFFFIWCRFWNFIFFVLVQEISNFSFWPIFLFFSQSKLLSLKSINCHLQTWKV